EIIAGAGPQPKNPARVRVFKVDTSQDVGNWKISPAIADFIASFRDMWTGKRYGVNVAAGDIDGDGVAEIILGAGPRPRNASYVKVYRGNGNPMEIEFIAYPDDAVILKPPGKQEIVENEIEDVEAIDKELNKRKGSTHGVYLTAGDLNGDGIAEIITGPGPGSRNKSLLRIFNAEGTLLREHLVYPDKGYGLKVSVGRTGAK
ncbi:MAG: hypothetical protein FJ243_00830, partial [Nitrospira sp.]|nr:hypothetical protein [Nitrospira sp.]